jgi:hypothetical protein
MGGDAPADVRTKLFEFACRSKALESLLAHASQSHLSSDAHRETCFPAHLAAAKHRCHIMERRQEGNVFRAQKQGIVLRMGTGSAHEAAEEEVLYEVLHVLARRKGPEQQCGNLRNGGSMKAH